MGRFVNGEWHVQVVNPETETGAFEREETSFHKKIAFSSEFKPESGRYHLYVSYACPWAHRTLIYRELKSLSQHISVSIVHPFMGDQGWDFRTDFSGATGDGLYGCDKLGDIYLMADERFTGRVTVPVLWDKQTKSIVNNESSEIIRMFNESFNGLSGNEDDFYPKVLRSEIDELNAYTYQNINNGVYRAGFARSQDAYEKAVGDLFAALDTIEQRLAGQKYLLGEHLSEADIRLFPTLIRFDLVYVCHFKCNLRRIEDYPNLRSYLRRLYSQPAFRSTTHFDHIKHHYYASHPTLNPFGLIPVGPELEYVSN